MPKVTSDALNTVLTRAVTTSPNQVGTHWAMSSATATMVARTANLTVTRMVSYNSSPQVLQKCAIGRPPLHSSISRRALDAPLSPRLSSQLTRTQEVAVHRADHPHTCGQKWHHCDQVLKRVPPTIWIGHIVTPLVTMQGRQVSIIHVAVGDAQGYDGWVAQ